ncbi:odorant receptor 131-2-like [Notolabrus celidotus]|uniref:odorant receptor 131-2-like n=1 Tax=Notolabrus celidotus TaxID=1203425 RepID=UPI00148F6719|nr:odorant receptor 131-2-like [Notolabrus celidotus]
MSDYFSRMSFANQSVTNITTEHQYQGLLERVLLSALITAPCCVFLFINGTMLFILRSKAVFCETSRYILLYNLLFADTTLMVLSQIMFILSSIRVRLMYPVCGFLIMLADLTKEISPLTLVVMSVERYVAVCYPLRHATIITMRNTWMAIFTVWAFSSLNVLTRVILLLHFRFEDLESLQMTYICSARVMWIFRKSNHYEKAYTVFVFVSAGVAITSSYIGVMIAARSASTDKASTRKTRNTLLLHLIQLGLSLSSTIQNPLLIAISGFVTRLLIIRIQIIFYVCIFIFPRCLSSLIYGIRDQSIRPLLTYHLCCRLRLSED